MRASSTSRQGFTIVELIIIIVVLGILGNIIIGALGDLYYANTTSLGSSTVDTDARSALRQVESDTSTMTRFLNEAEVNSANIGPPGSSSAPVKWIYNADTAKNSLIVETNAPSTTNSLTLVGTGCNLSDPSATITPMKNLYVYFSALDSSTNKYNLYRRTIVNWDNKPVCAGNTPKQKTSCKSGCAATDAVLVRNITAFQLTFTADGGTTVTGGDIPTAKSVDISMTVNRTVNGTQKPSTVSIKISKLTNS